MLHALQPDALERGVERSRQQSRQLDQRHAEMLGGTAGQACPLVRGQRRVRAGEVVEGEPASTAQRHVAGVAEAPTEPQAERQREPSDRGDERGRG